MLPKKVTKMLTRKTPLKGKKKLNKQSKLSIAKLRHKADQAVGKKVRSLGYCQLKGLDKIRCGGPLNWAHIITRSNFRLRHEPLNALCICSGHHRYYTTHAWEWREIIEANFPENFEFIQAHRNEIFKSSPDYYQAIIQKAEGME